MYIKSSSRRAKSNQQTEVAYSGCPPSVQRVKKQKRKVAEEKKVEEYASTKSATNIENNPAMAKNHPALRGTRKGNYKVAYERSMCVCVCYAHAGSFTLLKSFRIACLTLFN